MNTIPLSQVPQSLGAWDAMIQSARTQRMENQAHEAELSARVAQNVDDLRKLIAKGDLEAPVFFLPRSKPVRADKLWEILQQASEYEDFQKRLITLLFFADAGCNVTEYARELMRLFVEKAAEVGAEALVDPVTAAGFGGCNV